MLDHIGSWTLSLAGGTLIGLSASIVLLFHGRVTGISGIFGGSFLPRHDARDFRLWFLAGLMGSGVALVLVYPAAFVLSSGPSLGVAAIAGLLVGYGTRLGGGCTSGHGICGIARLSRRSFVATAVFIATAMVTVYVVRHLVGSAAP
jgi:uncharacterized protein